MRYNKFEHITFLHLQAGCSILGEGMDRRAFLKSTTSTATLLRCFPADLSAIQREKRAGGLERRSLGKTGEKLSILGFGGIVVMNASTEQAAQRVREAIEAGVNYFDVAPSYGNAEDMLGPALEPYRKDVFLACKTQERDKAGAVRELESSLKKMRTDHFDLYQLHGVTKLSDVETILGPNGALEAFVQARKAGKVRFLGFSAHSIEAALTLIKSFDFDTVLYPINYAIWHAGNFGPQVLAKAQEKKMGILALKSMCKRPWPEAMRKNHPHPKCWYEPFDKPEEATMGLRFTLSHPVTAAIPPGDEDIFKMALGLAAKFKPLATGEMEEIKKKALATPALFKYPMAG
jgi:predicted aldo/keto reductase-like oxidoreductase